MEGNFELNLKTFHPLLCEEKLEHLLLSQNGITGAQLRNSITYLSLLMKG
jgi:hypothetical protein